MATPPPRPPNKPGRPKVEPSDPAPSVYTHITLPAALYDKAYAAARRERMTVPEFIRHALKALTADRQ